MSEWLDQLFNLGVVIITVAKLAAGLLLISLAPTPPRIPLVTTGSLQGIRL